MRTNVLVFAGIVAGVGGLATPALAGDDLPGTEKWAKVDREFLTKAAQGGLYEVRVAQLALERTRNATVHTFAQKMIDDHSKANDQLKQLASQKGITLPGELCARDQSAFDKLSRMSGSDFDQAYRKAMVKDHDTDVSEFEKEAKSGKDSELRTFAQQTLPTLMEHDHMAKSDRDSMK